MSRTSTRPKLSRRQCPHGFVSTHPESYERRKACSNLRSSASLFLLTLQRGGDSTSVECLLSMNPWHTEEEVEAGGNNDDDAPSEGPLLGPLLEVGPRSDAHVDRHVIPRIRTLVP